MQVEPVLVGSISMLSADFVAKRETSASLRWPRRRCQICIRRGFAVVDVTGGSVSEETL